MSFLYNSGCFYSCLSWVIIERINIFGRNFGQVLEKLVRSTWWRLPSCYWFVSSESARYVSSIIGLEVGKTTETSGL